MWSIYFSEANLLYDRVIWVNYELKYELMKELFIKFNLNCWNELPAPSFPIQPLQTFLALVYKKIWAYH